MLRWQLGGAFFYLKTTDRSAIPIPFVTSTEQIDSEPTEEIDIEPTEEDDLEATEESETPFPEITPTPETKTYQEPDGFYSLQYPAGWTSEKAGSEQHFCDGKNENICFAVSIQIKVYALEPFIDQETAWMKQHYTNYRQLGRSNFEANGYLGTRVEHQYQKNGVQQNGFMVVLQRGRIGFELLGWAPEDDYADVRGDFKEISQSFKIIEFPEAPAYDNWNSYSSQHFVYYYLPETWIDSKIEDISADHEDALAFIQKELKINNVGLISFYFYPSSEALYYATARDSGFAINEANEVHSLWISEDDHQTLGHEMTHVITYQAWGNPSQALMGEGTATCLDQSGRDYKKAGLELYKNKKLIPFSQLLGEQWFEQDASISYQQSGSFICYLMTRTDAEEFKTLYQAEDFEAALTKILGDDLQKVIQDWLEWLQQ